MVHFVAHCLNGLGRALLMSRKLHPGRWWLIVLVVLPVPAVTAAPEDLAVGTYVLETDPLQNVSLKANQASLYAILGELASDLDIEVENRAGEDTLVVTEFSSLPLAKALKRLSESSMIVSDEMSGRVAKIILLPKGDGSRYVAPAQAPVSTTEEGFPETESQSFEFEFDPNAAPVDDPESAAPDDAPLDFEAEMQEDVEDK
jgi:hypothetical protein